MLALFKIDEGSVVVFRSLDYCISIIIHSTSYNADLGGHFNMPEASPKGEIYFYLFIYLLSIGTGDFLWWRLDWFRC